MTSIWEQLLQTLPALLIPLLLLAGAWRNHHSRPVAARLFLAAVACQFLQVVLTVLLLIINGDVYSVSSDDGGWDWSDPQVQFLIGWQLLHAALDIVAWSLMAWAILRRPEERRRNPAD